MLLFDAHLKDGTRIIQTPEDTSQHTEGKNAFYDVLQRIDEVVFFGLFDDAHTYGVDLEHGHFQIDGVVFHAQDPRVEIGSEPLRLIYFKRNKLHFVGSEQVGADLEYHIGWQTNIDGKNVQQTIAVK